MSYKCSDFSASFVSAVLLAGLTNIPATSVSANACKAALEIRFSEGAPRDRFHIDNTSDVGVSVVGLTFDLSTSAGRLIFDTSKGGSGVAVFQKFRVESADNVKSQPVPAVADGAERLGLNFDSFASGSRYTFSIDVDDRLTNSELGQIRVSGNEMENAQVSAVFKSESGKTVQATGAFDARNRLQMSASCDT